ncbi:hypothetical protein PMG11_10376 [Penicillium brasilianum]|uniref:Uncharacterized protein n=1 Tax=Penicillium brasilianum TaxID=104259 RepID=A0A0F7TYQ9_PENBI|nr:hypothetical protein PMG11_10376 [Penicillium brasilianum]
MTHHYSADACEDDSIMVLANEQLECELLESQKTPSLYAYPPGAWFFGIFPGYMKDWTQANAFRELYQNWKDALMERFELDRQSFQPVLEDHSGGLSIIVPDRNLADRPAESDDRRALGFIPIANACMRLPINALGMGFSTKDAHDRLVVCHGEGLKPAALVLSRDGFQDIRGLTYPSDITSTPHGDLILDPQLRGQLYHNGITLTNSTVGGAFLFAYKFAYSTTCRDRGRLASWRDAARQVQQTWEEALRKQEDTHLASTCRSPAEARPFRRRRDDRPSLRATGGASDLAILAARTANTIRDSLGKRSARLPDTLWHILRAHCPIRTVEEDRQELFKDAKPCVIPNTTCARTVDRALRA